MEAFLRSCWVYFVCFYYYLEHSFIRLFYFVCLLGGVVCVCGVCAAAGQSQEERVWLLRSLRPRPLLRPADVITAARRHIPSLFRQRPTRAL